MENTNAKNTATRIQPLPDPRRWANLRHFLKTLQGILDSAEMFLPPADVPVLLETMGDECRRRLQRTEGGAPEALSIADIATAMERIVNKSGVPDRLPRHQTALFPEPAHAAV